ncbi:MAG: hypothetical protein ACXVLQ_04900 [Bacteriovorax sp.]
MIDLLFWGDSHPFEEAICSGPGPEGASSITLETLGKLEQPAPRPMIEAQRTNENNGP